jgi:hypothetical protein
MICLSIISFVQRSLTTFVFFIGIWTHFILCSSLYAQNGQSNSLKYFEQSVGYSHVTTRDLATSPLFYSGTGAHVGLNWRWRSEKHETSTGVELNGGILSSRPPQSAYFQTKSRAYFLSLGIQHNYLHKLKINLKRIGWYLGGELDINLPVRYNPSLGNSSFAADPLFNISAASKLIWNVSRQQKKPFKFWFIERTLKPVKREWSWLLNIGVLNFNYRPGYAYSYDSAFNGSETGLVGFYFANHKFRLNGWRAGSRITFTRHHANGNGIQLYYNWEVMTAKGSYEPLNLAWHQLGITLMIKRKSSL